MKKLLNTIILTLICTFVFSQNISVSSFRCIEEDITARHANIKDMNGELCALIIVNTPIQGFEFSVANIEKTEQKTGEIWIYLSPGSRFITLKHRDLGSLRNYNFPQSIESGKTYEMVLRTAKITQIVEETITDQYLIIRSKTPDAKIFINNEYIGKGEVQKYLPIFEEHSYKVEAPLYHTKTGKVRLNSEDRTELQIDLEPAFGYLKVNTIPVQGAEIEINSKMQEQLTPFTTQALESGVYTVQAFKPMYKSNPVEVHLHDGESVEVNIDLIPTFANVEIICQDKEAEIHIDGQYKAKGVYKSAMSAGNHRLEVKKSSYRTLSKNLNVVSGNDFVENLDSLQAINGTLNITSNPFDAEIYIDGKQYGKTPRLVPNVLIGQHSLELKKEGYKTLKENIIIEEGKKSDYAFDLKKEASIMISSEPPSAKIEIGGVDFGYTPAKITSLEEGVYSLKLSKSGYNTVFDQFTLKSGCNNPLSYKLISSDRFLNISSSPSGAEVYLDGEYKGTTPTQLKNVEAGKYKLELSKKGYKDYSEKIKIKGETDEYYSLNMKKKKQIIWKDLEDCRFYASADASYVAGNLYYGASISLFGAFDLFLENYDIPMLSLGVTYLTKYSNVFLENYKFLITGGFAGARFGFEVYGTNEDTWSFLIGYSFAYKRMIIYADWHRIVYNPYLSSSYDDMTFDGLNLGIGFAF